mmetsp:Transcript_46383/g.154808  ORF Transcript_46383/g.154808 Transcript_46383/m.154808 type:complete len:263 (+) Transcript_46383:109-897(+)
MQRAPHPASSVVGHREREQRVARSLLSHSGQRSVLSTEKRTAGLAAALPKVAGARRTRRPRGGVRGGGEEGGMEAGRLGGRENGGGGSRHRRRAAAATRCHCAACGVGAAGGPPPCRVHVCSTRRRRRRADVVEVPSPLSTSTSMNSGRQQRSMASSSTYLPHSGHLVGGGGHNEGGKTLTLDALARDRDRLDGLVDAPRADGSEVHARPFAGAVCDGAGKRLCVGRVPDLEGASVLDVGGGAARPLREAQVDSGQLLLPAV